MSLFISNNSL